MSAITPPLSQAQLESFHENGYLMLADFYDVERQIRPILFSIYQIIGISLKKYGLEDTRPPFALDCFDAGYQQLIALDRSIGGEIYDAVKQIAAFQRLCSCEANEALYRQIRNTELVGVAGGGSGIRIDNPGESSYQAPWHQEYLAQLRSSDGLVFWSPLRTVQPDLGPVEIARASHMHGLAKVYVEDDSTSGRQGAYALRIHNEEELLAGYDKVAPLSKPGDLLIMDWLTIHRSGVNCSNVSRWTMQLRFFNFCDEEGIRYGWKGSFAAGNQFEDILPGTVVKRGKEK